MMQRDENSRKKGQGFNDARGEVSDKENVPKNNGQNVNNDPAHLAEREKRKKQSLEQERISAFPEDNEDYKKIEQDLIGKGRNHIPDLRLKPRR